MASIRRTTPTTTASTRQAPSPAISTAASTATTSAANRLLQKWGCRAPSVLARRCHQGTGSIHRLGLAVASQAVEVRQQGGRRGRHRHPGRGPGDGNSGRDPGCGPGMQRPGHPCRQRAWPQVRCAGPACASAGGLKRSSDGARGWAAWPPPLSARPKPGGVPVRPCGRSVEACQEFSQSLPIHSIHSPCWPG